MACAATLPVIPPPFEGRIEKSVREMYEEDNLGATGLFSGDFINFGYWSEKINQQKGLINSQQRLISQQEMYRQVGQRLDITPEHTIVEVGSGRGVGANLISKEFKPKSVIGFDFCKSQVMRARTINQIAVSEGRVRYEEGDAQALPLKDASVDRIYSVEAAQHFPSIRKFFAESSRVLVENGKICVATFFGCHSEAKEQVAPLVQTVNADIDHLPSIHSIKEDLVQSGFTDITIQSIGAHVWNGFDQWVSQTELRNSWTRNWKVAYEAGALDYYLIQGTKR